jgi:hypothetical protein
MVKALLIVQPNRQACDDGAMRILCSCLGRDNMAGNQARRHPDPLPQERELTEAAPGEPGDLYGTLIEGNQTEWDEYERIKPNQAGSRLIKVNQTESNLRWGRGADNGAASKRRKKRGSYYGCAPYAHFRGYAHGLARIKPNQGESNQIKPNQTCGVGGLEPEPLSTGGRTHPKGGAVWDDGFRRRDADGGGRDDRAPKQTRSSPVKLNQTGSNLRWGAKNEFIQSEQVKSGPLCGRPRNAWFWRTAMHKLLWLCGLCAFWRLCPWTCENQGESNQIKPNQTCGVGGLEPEPLPTGGRTHPKGGAVSVDGFCRRDAEGGVRDDRAPNQTRSSLIKVNQTESNLRGGARQG